MAGKYLLASAFLAVLVQVSLQASLDLPSYIKGCKKDANIDQCAVQNGNAAWAAIIKGDPKYKIPKLNPLLVKNLQINSNTSPNVQLELTLIDCNVHGLEGMVLKKTKFDFDKKELNLEINVPQFSLVGPYKINGKFLVLPINGNGPANITIRDMDIIVNIKYSLVSKNGEEFMKLDQVTANYETSRLHANFDNLFNGNKELSDNMNTVIDENWKEFNRDMGPPIGQAVASVLKSILDHIVELVPYNKVFL